jgi:hypothetical protein
MAINQTRQAIYWVNVPLKFLENFRTIEAREVWGWEEYETS